jgi:hypothetical protein
MVKDEKNINQIERNVTCMKSRHDQEYQLNSVDRNDHRSVERDQKQSEP